MTTRRVEVQKAPDAAFQRLEEAASNIGKVEQANRDTRSLTLKARYGLNPVRLRVSVLSGSQPETSVLDIQARGQDILGVASRKVIDRLIAAV